ncbi:MAG TPA: GGDEF domain-containing protein [Bryobacteraceae bacterium]|nr:GGDEF domain-containing protein [Bryobacteraceae bacterium]
MSAIRQPVAQRMVLAWLGICILSVVAGLCTIKWNGLTLMSGPVTINLTFYPPLTICLLTTFWLGPFWGIAPAYLTTLVLSVWNGMPLGTALVFSVATPITLTVLWSSSAMLHVSPSLERWVDRAQFALLALIATGASSVGALVWNFHHQLPFSKAQGVWRGWILGDFLQIVLIIGPLLYCLNRPAQHWIAAHITLPARRSLDARFYISVFILVFLVMIASGALAARLFLEALKPDQGAQAITVSVLRQTLREAGFFLGVYAICFLAAVVVFSYTLGSQIEQQRRKAYTDELTQCLNRRAFADIFAVEAARSERLGLGLSLLAIDLDHFKNINDRFGHNVGDHVLRAFAERMYSTIRRSDFFFRWGGEEFTLLLPCTEPGEAAELAERLRHSTAAEGFRVPGVGQEIRLTASFGVAGTLTFPAVPADLLKLADAGCYRAKERGRNRVELCGRRVAGADEIKIAG